MKKSAWLTVFLLLLAGCLPPSPQDRQAFLATRTPTPTRARPTATFFSAPTRAGPTVTYSPIPRLTPTKRPIYPTTTPVPTRTLVPALPTVIQLGLTPVRTTPYPTAKTVQADAVAFVVVDEASKGMSSLYVANVDGSGEGRLVDNLNILPGTGIDPLLQWSPNGKWISFRSRTQDELWLVAPDGSVGRKITFPGKDKRTLYAYQWSPDGSQIAYILTNLDGPWNPWSPEPGTVGILDATSGKVSELIRFDSLFYAGLWWLPNSKSFLLGYNDMFSIVDAASGKIIKELPWEGTGCSAQMNDRLIWSPNGKWFVYVHHGTGVGASRVLCVGGADGTNRYIQSPGPSLPVWDKAGDYIYFAATNVPGIDNTYVDPDPRLMRYDPRTGELVRLLTLGETGPYQYDWSVSLSPDGRTLEAHVPITQYQQSFVFFDIGSHSTTTSTLNFEDRYANSPWSPGTRWSSDNQNVILFSGGYSRPGAFYTINIRTGKTAVFSQDHWISEWAFSPRVTSP